MANLEGYCSLRFAAGGFQSLIGFAPVPVTEAPLQELVLVRERLGRGTARSRGARTGHFDGRCIYKGRSGRGGSCHEAASI